MLSSINQDTKDNLFDDIDRYYCKVNKAGKYSFSIGTLKDDPFNIKVDAISKEIFVTLIKSNSIINNYMLSLIYIKEQGKWKLNTLNIGDYSYHGMTAIDLYEKASSFDTKGYKVPAMLYLVLSNKLLRPAPFLQYKKESEITNYSKKLSNSLKKDYGFPKKLENTNNISIYGLDVQCVQEGLIAVIKYTTNTEMSNEKEIEKEANGINKEVTNLYLGMKENFKFFMYEAYSEPPIDIKKSYKCYRTIVQQK